MKSYDLVVVTRESFPYGQAATNRMLSYLKGIAKEKKVLFLTLSGPEYGNPVNESSSGRYDNIDYRYFGPSYLKDKPSSPMRFFALCRRYVSLIFYLLFFVRFKSVLVYIRDCGLIIVLKAISKIKNARIFRDVTETNGRANTDKSEKLLKRLSGYFDGLIVISRGIWDFFDNITDRKKFLLPVLVDAERFENRSQNIQPYFFCCSGANLERDGLSDMLKGFMIFHRNHPSYRFVIASSFNMSDDYHSECYRIIQSNTDCMDNLGPVPAFRIPELMTQATALVLTPHTEYATRGFPTKLGEYLMSGRPVICSRTDCLFDVVKYDAVYWVEPNNPDQIADKMNEIVENPEKAGMIGSVGRDFMKENYTIDTYIKNLMVFMGI